MSNFAWIWISSIISPMSVLVPLLNLEPKISFGEALINK